VTTPGRVRHAVAAPWNWIGHTLSNAWGIANVFDLAWLRPTPGGLLEEHHPFVTGRPRPDQEPIWPRNVLYRSRPSEVALSADLAVVHAVMDHMRGMVAASAVAAGRPRGKRTRMPPAINYIHGPVHYNGVSVLFDDVPDATRHLTDVRFLTELRRFIAAERREITVILRERDYDREALATLACLSRTVLPFWANPNGNKRRVHWGVPAPYPNINVITGEWIGDTRMLLTAAGRARVARPPIEADRWFVGDGWGAGRDGFLWPERWLAWVTGRRVVARGDRGGMYFTDARRLKLGFRYDPDRLPSLADRLAERAWSRINRMVARASSPRDRAATRR
jgi:hypothetical protein